MKKSGFDLFFYFSLTKISPAASEMRECKSVFRENNVYNVDIQFNKMPYRTGKLTLDVLVFRGLLKMNRKVGRDT